MMAKPIINTVPKCPYCGQLANEEQTQVVKDINKDDPDQPAFIDCLKCRRKYECDLVENEQHLGNESAVVYWTFRFSNRI